jgi:23S rRNA G2445 N2-methylase RlmL
MLPFLAKPQTFLVKPAPGWLDLAHEEVCRILENPLQKYKFSPVAKITANSILVDQFDFRQGLELVLRATLLHDVELVLHSGRVTTRAGWNDFFVKSRIQDVWPATKDLPLQLIVRVTHPVVGSEKEVRDRLKTYLVGAGISTAKVTEDQEIPAINRLRLESEKNRTQMLLSLAGAPLYIRSYKDILTGASAPLPEHHAAACFRWANALLDRKKENSILTGNIPVVVPFAGTGTLGFESLCQILQYAPGLFRSNYAFQRFMFHPEKTAATIARRLHAGRTCGSPRIIFGEIDPKACQDLKANIAGFERRIGELLGRDQAQGAFSCMQNDFLKDPDLLISDEREIFILLNPPYGERLAKKTGPEAIYSGIGKILKKLGQKTKFSGLILCGNEVSWREFLGATGPIYHKTRHFTHGGMDVRAVVFSNVEKLNPREP